MRFGVLINVGQSLSFDLVVNSVIIQGIYNLPINLILDFDNILR
jgi:hypothetical protein